MYLFSERETLSLLEGEVKLLRNNETLPIGEGELEAQMDAVIPLEGVDVAVGPA